MRYVCMCLGHGCCVKCRPWSSVITRIRFSSCEETTYRDVEVLRVRVGKTDSVPFDILLERSFLSTRREEVPTRRCAE